MSNDTLHFLALDLAIQTGWAALSFHGGVESGVQTFDLKRGDSPGMRFFCFRVWVEEMLDRVSPSVVIYELAHHRGGAATEIAVGFQTRVQEIAASRGIDYVGVHTASLKKFATGSGRAGKPEMIVAARKRWPRQNIEDDNQADALCLLAYMLDVVTGQAASERNEPNPDLAA